MIAACYLFCCFPVNAGGSSEALHAELFLAALPCGALRESLRERRRGARSRCFCPANSNTTPTKPTSRRKGQVRAEVVFCSSSSSSSSSAAAAIASFHRERFPCETDPPTSCRHAAVAGNQGLFLSSRVGLALRNMDALFSLPDVITRATQSGVRRSARALSACYRVVELLLSSSCRSSSSSSSRRRRDNGTSVPCGGVDAVHPCRAPPWQWALFSSGEAGGDALVRGRCLCAARVGHEAYRHSNRCTALHHAAAGRGAPTARARAWCC